MDANLVDVIYLLGFVVLVLATARLTRVFSIDEIAAPLRDWILGKWGENSKPGKLARCYWCAGFWVALLLTSWTHASTVGMGWVDPRTLVFLPVEILAVAYAAPWVLDKEEN